MEKSAFFNSKLLPYLLLVPQLIITFVFFYWPASQAVWQSFLREDAFGLSSEFIGLENYQALLAQPEYYRAMLTTLVFSSLVAVLSLSIALLFATQADKNLKAAPVYKTLMIWPYAVAPAVAGVLWIFMFHPSLGTLARRRPRQFGRSICRADGDRDRADRDPVPLCRAQGAILMVEHRPWNDIIAYAILTFGVFIVAFPVYLALIASTHDAATVVGGNMPLSLGSHILDNYYRAIFVGASRTSREPVGPMLPNSLISATGIAVGKIFISILSAYAVVYFRFPFRKTAFWIIFVTLMLPVEVRIYPTYKVVSDLHMLDTYAGLILPLIASATGTLLFRQFFMTVPDELLEASRIDGAGPFRFFWDTLLPLSITTIAALFVIQFIYGWNQYLWPLLITTQDSMQTIVTGIKKMLV